MNKPGVRRIVGTYRSQPAIRYVDPKTGLSVMTHPDGRVWSNWKLNPGQLTNVLTGGGLSMTKIKIKREKDEIILSLGKDEAIVLFEFLAEFNENDQPDLFNDQADQRVLYDIESVLETVIDEAFSDDYLDVVAKARGNVRDNYNIP